MREIDLRIDVTEAAALGISAHTAATVYLPEPAALAAQPVVCFAFPGGGYCRRYYSFDMPDSADNGEAGWHVARGWIFVACDHLGFGDSTIPDGNALNLENVARGNKATVDFIMRKLETGTLLEGYPAIRDATKLGIGQSMGGCFTIVQQAQHGTFDGIATLGYSGIHTVVPGRPGTPTPQWPWIRRGVSLESAVPLNAAALAAAPGPQLGDEASLKEAARKGEHPFAWSFHFDDEPADIVALDMAASAGISETLPPWRSATTPACGVYMVAPGAVATEAAAITVPVLAAMGERDVVPNPWLEALAFKSTIDFTLFVCPRMAHMHNFATTRYLFWQKIHSWGNGVAEQRALRAR